MRAQFVNEVIKHLSPKSEEEIRSSFKNLSPQEKLLIGIEEHDIILVKQAFKDGAKMYSKIIEHNVDEPFNKAVYEAIYKGQEASIISIPDIKSIKIIQLFLDKGVYISRRRYGPLYYAIITKNNKIHSLLQSYIKKNNDVKKLLPLDAFKIGLSDQNLSLIKYALSNGVDIHFNNDNAMQFASWANAKNTKLLSLLINAGATITKKDLHNVKQYGGYRENESYMICLAAYKNQNQNQ